MGISDKIREHRRIMFDSVPLIYFIEENHIYGEMADKIFRIIKNNSDFHAFSSVITLIEVLTYPMRKSDEKLSDKYRNFLLGSANFTIYDIDPFIAELAAKLRARYGIRTPDAIQLATGIEEEGTLFVTNDKQLKKIGEIEVMILDDYLESKF